MDTAFVPVSHASTEAVPPDQRIEYWEAHNAAELVGLRCSDYSPAGLFVGERNFDLGALRLSDIRGAEHVIERPRQMIKTHPKDALFASVLLDGAAFFYQSGACITLKPGDIVVYPTVSPYLFGFSQPGTRQILVDISVNEGGSAGVFRRPAEPLKIDAQSSQLSGVSQSLRTTLAGFVQQPLAGQAPHVAQRIQFLLAQLMGLPDTAAQANAFDARFHKAEAFIARHLCDPHLDAAAVAAHLHMSVRTLNRVFSAHNTTVAQRVWSQRLQLARTQLEADPAISIGQVALGCGFSTQAHFASSFKAAFGMTPSEYRRQYSVAS